MTAILSRDHGSFGLSLMTCSRALKFPYN